MPMAVSTGAVDITPGADFPMAGFGVNSPRLSAGVREPLHARCIILWDDGTPNVIVTVDVLAFGRQMHLAVRNRVRLLGVANHDFVLTATHTHNGPVLLEKLDPFIAYNLDDLTEVTAYCDALVDDIVSLVRTTMTRSRTPCTLDYQVVEENFSINREGLPYREVDVPVLVARGLGGEPRAVLFSYGAHPVAANLQDLFDPDYPAQAIKEIEATGGNVFAQFVLGPAGDQNPISIGSFPIADGLGQDLGATVANGIAVSGRELNGPIASEYLEIELPLDLPPAEAVSPVVRAAYVSRLTMPLAGFAIRHAQAMIAELDALAFSTSVTLPVQVWRFQGNPGLNMIFCGGEVVSGYAVALRSAHGGSSEIWFNGYSNEVPSYVPSDELLDHPSYAGGSDPDAPGIAGGSMTVYGYCGHFLSKRGPGTPDGVEQILLARLKAML
ncbi:hypothetical protein [Mycetocola sp.]|uniref:hypothetical protein n=1 Tax=Mycetocola sp. TaxID=1871042 RepID=UPI003988CE9D